MYGNQTYPQQPPMNMAAANQQFANQIAYYNEAQLRAMLSDINNNLINPNISPEIKMQLANQKEVITNKLRTMMQQYQQPSYQQQQQYSQSGYQQQQYPQPSYQQQSPGYSRYSTPQQTTPNYGSQSTSGSRYANDNIPESSPYQQPATQQPVVQQPIVEEQTITQQPKQTIKKGTKMKMNSSNINLTVDTESNTTILTANLDLIKGLVPTGSMMLINTPRLLPKAKLLQNSLIGCLDYKQYKTLALRAKAISTLLNNSTGIDAKVIIEFNNYLTNLVNEYYSYRGVDLAIESFIEDIAEVESGLDPMEIGDEFYSKIDGGLSDIRAQLTALYKTYVENNAENTLLKEFDKYLKTGNFTILPEFNYYGKINSPLEDNTYIPKEDEAYDLFYNLYSSANPLANYYVIDANYDLFVVVLSVGRFNIKKVNS